MSNTNSMPKSIGSTPSDRGSAIPPNPKEERKMIHEFNEAILKLTVNPELADVYKKAFEDDNSRYWTKSEIIDADGNLVMSDIKPTWSGNYCAVHILHNLTGRSADLTITLLSRTLPNLQETVNWYEMMGVEVVYKSYDT